jgi:hypothetical protein
MLSLEVMSPGGSLSRVLIATPYWQDTSWRVSRQAATAMAAYSCDWTAAALVLWLGSRQIGRKAIKNQWKIANGSSLLKRIQQIQKHLVLSG